MAYLIIVWALTWTFSLVTLGGTDYIDKDFESAQGIQTILLLSLYLYVIAFVYAPAESKKYFPSLVVEGIDSPAFAAKQAARRREFRKSKTTLEPDGQDSKRTKVDEAMAVIRVSVLETEVEKKIGGDKNI